MNFAVQKPLKSLSLYYTSKLLYISSLTFSSASRVLFQLKIPLQSSLFAEIYCEWKHFIIIMHIRL